MLITRRSPITGLTRSREIPVTYNQLQLWQEGALIQNVMGNLTDDEREFIMTGITEDEWDNMWGEEE